jgi:hypothetical protein
MHILEAISVFFMSFVKFFLAIPLAFTFDFSFWQTFLITCFGGILGVLFFAQFRKVILKIYYRFFAYKPKVRKKRGFKNILAIKTAKKYGLFGIAFLTPIVFSIPLGTFLALHFFPNKKKTLPILIASVLGWSFVLTLAWNIN